MKGGDDRNGVRHFVRGEDTGRGGHDDVDLEVDEFARQLGRPVFALSVPEPELDLDRLALDIAEIAQARRKRPNNGVSPSAGSGPR